MGLSGPLGRELTPFVTQNSGYLSIQTWELCRSIFFLRGMKRDGRKLAHNTLEEMRVLAVQRMNEGEHPGDVAASLGMHRS